MGEDVRVEPLRAMQRPRAKEQARHPVLEPRLLGLVPQKLRLAVGVRRELNERFPPRGGPVEPAGNAAALSEAQAARNHGRDRKQAVHDSTPAVREHVRGCIAVSPGALTPF